MNYYLDNKNFLVTVFFLLVVTTLSLVASLLWTGGNFAYALDDPYIHMTTVKNFAEHGIWSVDGHIYASASSSPLWIFTLTPFYLLLGAKLFLYIPFILNVVFQVLSIGLIFKMIKEHTSHELHYLYGFSIVLLAPFITLSFGGMEHSLQIFLVLCLIKYFISYMQQENYNQISSPLLVIAPFVVFVRYEDMALVVVMSMIILFYFKNWKLSLYLLFSSLIFVILFGIWSKFFLGLGFVPSSIMAKSMVGNELNILSQIELTINKFIKQFMHPHIIILFILNLVIMVKSFKLSDKKIFLLTVLYIITLCTHVAFAKIGWLYRYEAYLNIFGMLNILFYFYSVYKLPSLKSRLILFLIYLMFLAQLFSPIKAILGTNNIYQQQIQMANFLHQECNECSVAANDIGAITYFTNIKLLDMYGLGSYEVIEHKKNGTYTNKVKNELLKNKDVSLVIVYDSWFKDTVLDNYTKIAEWKILLNVVCGYDTVSFYSRNDKIDENYLKIRNYSEHNLPKYVYIKLIDAKNK